MSNENPSEVSPKPRIGAALVVRNEAKRLPLLLKSLAWCDEIVVLCKQSTDGTEELLRQTNVKVICTERIDVSPVDLEVVHAVTCDWVIFLVASNIVDPSLAGEVKNFLDERGADYDILEVPFRRYVLGIYGPHSPWYSSYEKSVFRKSHFRIDYDNLHGAKGLRPGRLWRIKANGENCIYHLTHESADSMIDRHKRYWQTEGQLFQKRPLYRVALSPLRAFWYCLFRRRSIFFGYDYIALTYAFLSYHMMKYVYVWEKRKYNGYDPYDLLRENLAVRIANSQTKA